MLSSMILVRLQPNMNFPDRFSKNVQTKFYENPSGGSRLVSLRKDRQTDRRTDMTKLKVAFRNFSNAPQNVPFKLNQKNSLCLGNASRHTVFVA